MENVDTQRLPKELLQRLVNKSVSEKLGNLFREVCEINKDMEKAKAKEAKLMILDMVWKSCDDFKTKITARIERQQEV